MRVSQTASVCRHARFSQRATLALAGVACARSCAGDSAASQQCSAIIVDRAAMAETHSGHIYGCFPEDKVHYAGTEGTFNDDPKTGLVVVRIGKNNKITAKRKQANKRPRDEDTAEMALRRKLARDWPGAVLERMVYENYAAVAAPEPEPPPPPEPPPKRRRLPPQVEYDPRLPDYMRTGQRQGGQGGVREETRDELQVLAQQRDAILQLLDQVPAARVLQNALFDVLGKDDSDDDDDVAATPPLEQPEPAPAPAPRVQPRERAGRALRVQIREAHRLLRLGKNTEAAAALDRLEAEGASADAKKHAGDSVITRRAKEIRDLVFKQGHLGTTRRIIKEFLDAPEMKLLLPAHLQQTSKDAETAKMMLQAAKAWVKGVMKTTGRRSDEDRNALLAGISALMPKGLFELKRGRSAMRALGLSHAITRQAVDARQDLEDSGKGWQRVHTSPHCDRLDTTPIDKWWHEQGSVPDNDNKHKISVFLGVDEDTNEEKYTIHYRRLQAGNDKDAWELFAKSDYAKQCQEKSKTEKCPLGTIPQLKAFVQARCPCIKKRGVGECDCDICTTIHSNLYPYHQQVLKWIGDGDTSTCACGGACGKWAEATRSMDALYGFLFCPAEHLKDYDIGDTPFKIIPKSCATGNCKHATPFDTSKACGVALRMAPLYKCPVLASDEDVRWKQWQPRYTGDNKETGVAMYQSEFVPTRGSRRKFLEFFQDKLGFYAEHHWRVEWTTQSLRRVELYRPPNTAVLHCDFASQLAIQRQHLQTCGRREYLNNCVGVIGYDLREVQLMRPKVKYSRERVPTPVQQQHVDCFFGFSPPGHKPDARYYNTVYQDMISYLKTGEVRHGEWFYNKQRLRGGDHSLPLPQGFTEMDPSAPFPQLNEVIEELDGCACQFACGTQYRAVATGLMEQGVVRRHFKLAEKHGKNVCDGVSNIPGTVLRSAIAADRAPPPGSRETVVFMAREHPTPSVPKADTNGMWNLSGIFYGHISHKVIEACHVPEATTFTGTRKCHDFVGLSCDKALLDGDAPIHARHDFCFCSPCGKRKFVDCKFRGRAGATMKKHSTKIKKVTTSTIRTQQGAFENWCKEMHNQKLLAVRVQDPKYTDDFWLAKPTGAAIVATENFIHANSDYEVGFMILPIKWYDIVSGKERTYTLLNDDVYIQANATVRLTGLKFSQHTNGRYTITEDTHERILEAI